MNIILQTARLSLRRFSEADAGLLFDLDSDPEVTRYTGPALATIEEYRDKICNEFLKYDSHPVCGLFAAESAGEFLGWFLLRPGPDYRYAALTEWTRHSEIEVGYRLKRSAWGKGFATEAAAALRDRAFAEPKVTALVACSLVANRGSIHVMEKIGMSLLREFDFPGYGPSVTYARFRDSENVT